ncbi:hypothetical protein [Noviherbaspirillum soli]|uniref:hypothetical protein n=1 Tax=Noviherbaspirillum soli TaxID=1064518 RepID=UPI00188ACAE2|nr:hypothetical protein [Noviherbaspirillum soli]
MMAYYPDSELHRENSTCMYKPSPGFPPAAASHFFLATPGKHDRQDFINHLVN